MSAKARKFDVYEDEDADAARFEKRFKDVGVIDEDIQGRADFEDEEIDEDGAFDADDETVMQRDSGDSEDADSGGDDDDELFLSDEDDGDGEGFNVSDLLNGDDDDQDAAKKHSAMVERIGRGAAPQRKKQRVAEQTESVPEGEFNVGLGKVSMRDLMGPLASSAKKELERLSAARDKRVIAAPTAKVHRDRDLREVQYAKTSEEVTEWQPTVKAMREQAHVSFPVTQPSKHVATAGALVAAFRAETDMEKEISALLSEQQLTEKKILEDEWLAMRELDPAEAAAREAELQRMKHLLFYKERKMKRQKKIKSRKYRKILKKAKDKGKLTVEELRELDPEAAQTEEGKLEKDRALERMTLKHKTFGKWAEGASRSKNPLLKKQLQESHEISKELRRKIARIREHGENEDNSSSSGSDGDSDEQDASGSGEDLDAQEPGKGVMQMKFMQRTIDREKAEYNDLKAQLDHDDAQRRRKLEKLARSNSSDSGEEIEIIERSELLSDTKRVTGKKSFDPKGKAKPKTNSKSSAAGVAFVGQQIEDVAFGTGFSSKVTESIEITAKIADKKRAKKGARSEAASDDEKLSKKARAAASGDRSLEVSINSPDSARASYSINQDLVEVKPAKAAKQKQRPAAQKQSKSDDAKQVSSNIEVDEENIALVVAKAADKFSRDQNKAAGGQLLLRDADDDGAVAKKSNSKKLRASTSKDASNPWLETTADAPAPVDKKEAKKLKKLEQSRTINLDLGKLNELAQGATKGDEDGASGFNLIASASAAQKDVRIGSVFYESGFIERQLITRAFANDDVGAEFEALKQREIEDDLPTDSGPVSLPGWGSWAGEGVVSKPSRKDIEREKQLQQTRADAIANRTDAKLKHVILNQKRDKKVNKYTQLEVPYPFTSREAYERSLRAPLGKDWNTYTMHKQLVQPKIKTRVGHVIDPIEKKKKQ